MLNSDLVLKSSNEYELLDSGNGRKLERFGKYILVRPEKQAMWKESNTELWKSADAEYVRTNEKFGEWKLHNSTMLQEWIFKGSSFQLKLKLTPFGHVGIFPELKEQWDWITNVIRHSGDPDLSGDSRIEQDSGRLPADLAGARVTKILSLFSYTGAATLAAAGAGANVTHVDASKPAITWAVENQKLSNLEKKPIRWIVDDALKFVKREERRDNHYDGIVMDPPKFGRGPQGEVWQFEKDLPELLDSCKKILSSEPLFFLVTAYTVPISPITLGNLVSEIVPTSGSIEYGEIVIEESHSKRLLPTSIYARFSS